MSKTIKLTHVCFRINKTKSQYEMFMSLKFKDGIHFKITCKNIYFYFKYWCNGMLIILALKITKF